MIFLIGRIKFKQCRFRDIVELNNLWKSSNVNLNNNRGSNNNNFNWCKFNYCTHTQLLLPEKHVKKYLQSITLAYKGKQKLDKNIEAFTAIYQIQEVSNLLEERMNVEENLNNLEDLGKQDEEMKKLGQQEYVEYQNMLSQIDDDLITTITESIGKDNCRDIIFEINAGVGGQESMIFAHDLCQMYRRYFEHLGFTYQAIEIETNNDNGIGTRRASYLVSGYRAFELLRHEGGIHRVQRVPTTDNSGRMHTSTVSVVVMPQMDEIEVVIKESDLKIETKRSSAPGGQNVNKLESAVKITHLPTGISIESQSERTQIQNRKIVMIRLRAKLYEIELNNQKNTSSTMRKKQRGTAGRNEKIRTYNFNQDRITDHRLAEGTMHNLKEFMEGGEELKNLQERLQKNFQIKLMQETVNNCK